jgi:hypothetical protein
VNGHGLPWFDILRAGGDVYVDIKSSIMIPTCFIFLLASLYILASFCDRARSACAGICVDKCFFANSSNTSSATLLLFHSWRVPVIASVSFRRGG